VQSGALGGHCFHVARESVGLKRGRRQDEQRRVLGAWREGSIRHPDRCGTGLNGLAITSDEASRPPGGQLDEPLTGALLDLRIPRITGSSQSGV
jgi:hypothetical protein